MSIINELRDENDQLRGQIDDKNEQIFNLKEGAGQLEGDNAALSNSLREREVLMNQLKISESEAVKKYK